MDGLAILAQNRLPFAELLGLRFISASPDRIEATMEVREDLCTTPAVLHGGAIMSLADTLGACATVLNLEDGAGTTTLESKTNFLAPAPVNTTVKAECTPIHRGKRTMVWQTRVTGADGRLVAIVTQTQIVLDPRPAK
ncbi:MAG TPA: PaaI family thioesterase [Candidatus Binataceae bacterium]|nr:PaaI family thioesterase [Candidatus Binataceae bacterium]